MTGPTRALPAVVAELPGAGLAWAGLSGAGLTARILIVDDEPANTTILNRLLSQTGYADIAITNDAREAIPLCNEFHPDIVLLDLHMPRIDGYEILGQLADLHREGIRLPVVVLTADATRAARERALRLGAIDFLTKPLDHLEVLLRIRSHLATRFLEQELLMQNADLERIVAERTAGLQETIDFLHRVDEQRRRLARAVVAAGETERRRIASDVHDGSVQTLVALGIRIELIARRLPDGLERTDILAVRADVGAALDDLRDLTFRLTPPSLEREGLAAALAETIERHRTVDGPVIELAADLSGEPSHDAGIVLYRIAQESLNNALRHGHAQRIVVSVATEGGGVGLKVRDDGRGFQIAADGSLPRAGGHLGLASMRERAELAGGWWRIESTVDSGTTVTTWVLSDAAGADDAADDTLQVAADAGVGGR